ncbi:hypothetical protein TWF696_005206 [Orbilia brochopaga]|uniref:Uncharacterized protein n=1 Tax=Orbilia brochopaga TaxID=3140254 RepID=A0AAV9V340_9PEZI
MRGLLLLLLSPEEAQHIKNVISGSQERRRRLHPNDSDKKEDQLQRLPPPPSGNDNELKASIRLSSRVFVAGSALLAAIDSIRSALRRPSKPDNLGRGLRLRLPLSLSMLLLLHRFFHRAVIRLQSMLSRFPSDGRFKRTIMSPLAPSVAAALSGVSLAIVPSENVRLTIAVYVFTKTVEYLFNALQEVANMPRWFGAWLLFPFSSAQLFHALLTDQGSVPFIYRKILMTFPGMFATEPGTGAANALSTNKGALMGEMAKLNFPAFNSTILFPKASSTLHSIDPIIRQAHPAIELLVSQH